MAAAPSAHSAGPSVLAVPSSLQDELYKEIQETGMYHFVQQVGLPLPELKTERWPGGYALLEELASNQRTACEPPSDMPDPAELARSTISQQQTHDRAEEPPQVMPPQLQAQAAEEHMLKPVEVKEPGMDALREADVVQAAVANKAADDAVREAQAILAAARTGIHTLAGLGPSSSNASDGGHAPELPGYGLGAAVAAGAEEDEGTSNCRRRRSGRGDQNQHSGLATIAAAAAAAAAASGGAGSGAGSGKASKGLRHFSMKVCEKVESKGTTTYNEVADELVNEMRGDPHEDGVCYDEKNIRRRVYDAINVLMALDIIAKEKKAIMWKGFPQNRSGSTPVQRLLTEKTNLAHSVERKAESLAELIEQQKALKHLLQRNLAGASATGTALQLPFILVQAKPDATVEVQISDDMKDVVFDFYNSPFQIHDDSYVLRMLAMDAGGLQTAGGSGATEGATGISNAAAGLAIAAAGTAAPGNPDGAAVTAGHLVPAGPSDLLPHQ